MPKIIRTIINDRPATITYLTELGGDICDSEIAKAARIAYDDGETGLYIIEDDEHVATAVSGPEAQN